MRGLDASRASIAANRAPLRLAVVGKGGSGKSVVAGTMARLLARRGHRVLALDSDPMPGLAFSLGARPPAEPPLNAMSEGDENGRWRRVSGAGPVRAVQRYSTEAPDGVRLLQSGNVGVGGEYAITGAVIAFYWVVHRIGKAGYFDAWTMVGDLSAGQRQVAYDWAPYATTFMLVVEPTWKSALTARRIIHIGARAGLTVHAVASKVGGRSDRAHVEALLGHPVVAAVPLDPAVAEAERLGVAPIDHAPACAAVAAIDRLLDTLEGTAGGARRVQTPSAPSITKFVGPKPRPPPRPGARRRPSTGWPASVSPRRSRRR
jgi:CO dehydrogenase maturation factor